MMSSQEVPQGYKQTKVGVVPVEWEEYRLNDILNLTLEPLKMEDDKEYELITVRRRFGGIDSRGLFKGKEILVKNQFYVRENNFVISKRQISHGACGLVPKELDGAIVSNEYNVFQPNIELLNQEFFNYYVRLSKFSQTFYNYSDGVHIEKLLFKTQSWLKQKIPFPPLKEQQKIAQILTTWDRAIEKLEALIEEKERLKKGLMQKLLSGEVRFEGFDEEWEDVRLGDVGTVVSGLTYSPSNVDKNGVLVLRSSNIQNRKLTFNDNVFVSVNTLNFNPVEENDILICVRNGSKSLIGKNALIDKKNEGLAFGAFMSVFRSKYNVFLFQLFDSRIYKREVYRNLGATINSINGSDLKKFKIPFPPLQEQQKIAQVLTTADKEIELLKKELEALKEQKRGLMQKLLSGEVRVSV